MKKINNKKNINSNRQNNNTWENGRIWPFWGPTWRGQDK